MPWPQSAVGVPPLSDRAFFMPKGQGIGGNPMADNSRVQISVVISQTARDLIMKNSPGKHAYGYTVDAAIKHYFSKK